MRTPLRSILISLVALVAIGGAVTALTEEKDSSPISNFVGSKGACESEGVTLVIDFGAKSDKPPIETCEKKFSGNGWQLFDAAGIEIQGTSEFPEGFVCRIQNWPSDSVQDCADTPTYSEGTWAYYYADSKNGSKWLLSGAGAAMRNPECGSIEGWLFLEPGEDRSILKPSIDPHPFVCK